jgi:hypothetical protein
MAEKSIAEKLLVKANSTVWCSDAAKASLLEPLPAGAAYADSMTDAATVLIFADGAAPLRSILEAEKEQLAKPAVLWVAYPKANRADINRDTLWPILAEYGLRPISQVAIDDVWSALRFRPLKEGEAPLSVGR